MTNICHHKKIHITLDRDKLLEEILTFLVFYLYKIKTYVDKN
jgi:hypothetical protein